LTAGRDDDELMSLARVAAEEGERVAMSWFDQLNLLPIEEKTGPGDLVSQADRDTEDAIKAVLNMHRPQDAILGEETGRSAGTSDIEWLVDPIDGTTNYLYGRADWAVSVAARRLSDSAIVAGAVSEPVVGRLTVAGRGRGTWVDATRMSVPDPVDLERVLVEVNFGRAEQKYSAGPMIDALIPCVRDVRRGGSAACALAQVATGRADAAWLPGLQPWDGAAGLLLVLEAGGSVGDLTQLSSGAWPHSGDILAAGPQLWKRLQHLLNPAYKV
jgi:myo-inositol-1(or 4)-monophosphatase